MESAALQSNLNPAAGSVYPKHLDVEIAHADCLARAVEGLLTVESPSSDSFVWLVGRAEEIRAFVEEITREWREGRIDTSPACDAMKIYLDRLHTTLEQWYGKWYYPSCCGPYGYPAALLDAPSAPCEHGHENDEQCKAAGHPISEVRRAAGARRWSDVAETMTMTVPAVDDEAPTVQIRAARRSGVEPREAAPANDAEAVKASESKLKAEAEAPAVEARAAGLDG